MVDVAEVVDALRPVDLGSLVVEGVAFLPRDGLLDGVDRRGTDLRLVDLGLPDRRGSAHKGQISHDEGVPVAVDLLARGEHSVVDRRAMAPSGGGNQVADRELLGVEQRDGTQAAVLAAGRHAADDVVVLDGAVVHLVEAGRQGAGERGVRDQAGDDDGALGEVIVHSVVGALGVVAANALGDGHGVEDDGGARKLGPAARERKLLGGLGRLAVLARRRVEDVDDVDGADVPEGVVEVRVHDLAERKGAPVGRIAELALRVDHVAELDRLVDDAGVCEAAHEVDGCRADIDRRGARLYGALCHSFTHVAVCAVEVFICHLLFLLCIKLEQPAGCP